MTKPFLQEQTAKQLLYWYLCGLLLIAAVVSVVLVPSLSVSVPSYIAIYLAAPLVFLISFRLNRGLLKEFQWILLVYGALNLLAQLNNYAAGIQLNDQLRLVKPGHLSAVVFRTTLFSQTFYLFSGVLLYLYLKYYATAAHIKYIYLGFRVLVVYGFLEVIVYQLTGSNGDFLSNREFDHVPGTGSLFQQMSIGHFTLQRLKSLTGEPSMFAFSVVPFWILAVGLRRRIDQWLFLAALLLSFSTSAFLGIFIFLLGWLVMQRQKINKYGWILVVALALFFLLQHYSAVFHRFFNETFWDKLTASNTSGSQRSGFFLNQLHFWWNDLNFFGKLVGLGFGYTRSTDFFSTLLVNNGLIGVGVFSWFFFKPAAAHLPPALQQHYLLALIATYLIMMISVPEFAYLSLWILLAFPYFAVRIHWQKNKEAALPDDCQRQPG